MDELFENRLLHQYSKDTQRPFDGESREQQLAALECCWGADVDIGIAWAHEHGLSQLECPLRGTLLKSEGSIAV